MNKFLGKLLLLGWFLALGLSLGVSPIQAQVVVRCDLEQISQLGEELHRAGTLTLIVPEEEVRRCLVRYQSQLQRETPFRSVEVDFHPGEIRIRGHLTWFSLTMRIEPYVEQGRIYIRLREVRQGFLRLPVFLFRSQVARLNAELERAFQRPPLSQVEIQGLDITEERLTLTITLRK